jgi:hypothetical protein
MAEAAMHENGPPLRAGQKREVPVRQHRAVQRSTYPTRREHEKGATPCGKPSC